MFDSNEKKVEITQGCIYDWYFHERDRLRDSLFLEIRFYLLSSGPG